MQAIILAAGMGKRLKGFTRDHTKCMVSVNGISLIERMLGQLDQLNLNRIIIVIGYKGQQLISFIQSLSVSTPIIYVENQNFSQTNNIYSLFLAKEYLSEDNTLLLESDIIFENSLLNELVNDKRETLALVDHYENWMDGTVVTIDEEDRIERFISKEKFRFQDVPMYYKTVNLYKFSKSFSVNYYIPFLKAYLESIGVNAYYEEVLRVLASLDGPKIEAKKLNGQAWYEIDNAQDLNIAKSIFAPPMDRLQQIQKRYGGYWRYPHLLDFCYLVNPFFPGKKLIEEMKANFNCLLCDYPSGMDVNSHLAADYYDLQSKNLVVGNGASELIKFIMELTPGKIGIIVPTFEEYLNRKEADDVIAFLPRTPGYTYTVNDLMGFFDHKNISSLVLINPDNPSGNYIGMGDLIRLLKWGREKKIKVIIDESFSDFAESPQPTTLLRQEILDHYPNTVIVKSLSKSFGVPGIRLGIAASGDVDMIKAIRKEVPIWNINSYAELFLQIIEKYKTEYLSSTQSFYKARTNLIRQLKELPGFIVFSSQANFVLCKLPNEFSSTKIAQDLLSDYNILIKDLSKKYPFNGSPYIRVAVKTPLQNAELIRALEEILKDRPK